MLVLKCNIEIIGKGKDNTTFIQRLDASVQHLD